MADNYNIRDASNTPISIAADEVSAGVYSPRVTPYVGGADVAVANPLPVNITTSANISVTPLVGGSAVSTTNPVPVMGNLTITSGSFARPADTTAYAVGDMVANSTSAAGLVTLANVTRTAGGTGYITRATIVTDHKANPSSYRVHLFNNATVTISNDNAPFRELYADMAKKVGSFVLGPMSTPADTTNSTISRAEDNNLRVPFQCEAGSRDLHFALEILTANTPASGANITLRVASDTN